MRGSSLANRGVLEALRPFVVVTWSGKPTSEEADEIRALWESSGIVYARKKRTNTGGFILDAQGKLVHSFGGFPNSAVNPNQSGAGEDARYFRDEIAIEATVEAVLTYAGGKATSLRGVVEGRYPRNDEFRGQAHFDVRATVESRP